MTHTDTTTSPEVDTDTEQTEPSIDVTQLCRIVEAALLAAGKPLNIKQISDLFDAEIAPGASLIREALALLEEQCQKRGIELIQVASGYRLQVRQELQPWISRLWRERPKNYSRALLETLALIAYRQPITRAEIEDVRGVSVSSNIIHTLLEREWIRELGHRDVPGRPMLYGSTKTFLDYFNLRSLSELPTLAEIQDIETFEPQLQLTTPPSAVNSQDATTSISAKDINNDNEDSPNSNIDNINDESE